MGGESILQEGRFQIGYGAAVGQQSEQRNMMLWVTPPIGGPAAGVEALKREEQCRVAPTRG